jgi:hypothetical protein
MLLDGWSLHIKPLRSFDLPATASSLPEMLGAGRMTILIG